MPFEERKLDFVKNAKLDLEYVYNLERNNIN